MSDSTQSLTQQLGNLTEQLRVEHLPALGVERAKASIVDWTGCALEGSASHEAASVRAVT